MDTHLNIENKEIEKSFELRSCCFTFNHSGFAFFAQFTMSIIAFGVSVAMILLNDENQSLWIGLISMIIGVYIPTPKLPEK